MENGKEKYSKIWTDKKISPNKILIIREIWACFNALTTIAWCDQVKLTPLTSNSPVFNKGKANSILGIPLGGHWAPTSGLGANLLWKNLQKSLKNNITSLPINKINPICPKVNSVEWTAPVVHSSFIVLNHVTVNPKTNRNEKRRSPLPPLIEQINDNAIDLTVILTKIGKGLFWRSE